MNLDHQLELHLMHKNDKLIKSKTEHFAHFHG